MSKRITCNEQLSCPHICIDTLFLGHMLQIALKWHRYRRRKAAFPKDILKPLMKRLLGLRKKWVCNLKNIIWNKYLPNRVAMNAKLFGRYFIVLVLRLSLKKYYN